LMGEGLTDVKPTLSWINFVRSQLWQHFRAQETQEPKRRDR
jgi:hypothetical protein